MFALDFLRKKEKFLLLEIAPKRTSALLIGVDGDKNISAEKFWEDFSFAKLNSDPLKNLRKRQVIVSAHPAFVTTITCPVLLERDDGVRLQPISLVELENLFSRAMGKIFSQHRGEAGKHLSVNEMDSILVGATAGNFKIDSHLILNPLGFHGKNIEAVLDLTFTSREIFNDLKDFFKTGDGFFFVGLPRAVISTISRIESPPINFVFLESGNSFYFVLDKAAWGHMLREGRINWSLNGIFSAIAGATGLSSKATFAVYDKYLSGDSSGYFARSLGAVIKEEKEGLLSELKGIGSSGNVYIHSPAPLPLDFPMRLGRATLDELPTEAVIGRLGFKIDQENWPFGRSETFLRLAPFFECYFDKGDSEINRRLRRRLHWLVE